MPSDSFVWDVALPERRQGAFGAARPRATLRVSSPQEGDETISLPLGVGKILKAKHDSGEANPASRGELMFLVRELSARCAATRIELLVNKRDYSQRELDDKLRADGYSSSVREQCLGRAIDCGLVSDQRYAAAFIRTKVSSGWGSQRIERELKRRGIEPSDVSGWPDEFFSGESEEERAYAVARTRRLAQRNGYEKLVRFLCGRGFGLSTSMRVARRVVDESNAGA
ncbi:MAG: regulatory protein RecX [Atopobiaceae bacterium]|nr:regulatory protein RecX [Atopobiaceae bacterium]